MFFTTDATGTQESRETLENGIRWLWFQPDIISAMLALRGTSLSWTSSEIGGIACGPGSTIQFGVNHLGLITVFASDIADLPDWLQVAWAGFNVRPEGGVSQELQRLQMNIAMPTTQAAETQVDLVYGL